MADLCSALNEDDQFGDLEVWGNLQDLETMGFITKMLLLVFSLILVSVLTILDVP